MKQEKELNSMSFVEDFNKIRSLTSLDLLQHFSVSAQGSVLGIGGSVSSTTEARAHSEVETEKFNHTKEERVLKDKFDDRPPRPHPLRCQRAFR